MSDRTPSRAEVVKAYVLSQLSELHVCLPGKVEKVDHDKQTVDVQPQIKRRLVAEDGTVSFERLPVLPSVPLGFPRAGGFYSYLPPSVGDHVMVHFTDYSLDEWWDQGRESEPSFAHSHELTDCYAVPGGYPKPKALSGLNGDDAVIGKESGSKIVLKGNGDIELAGNSEAVALADKTKTEIQKVLTALNAATYVNTLGVATTLVVAPVTLVAPASGKVKSA